MKKLAIFFIALALITLPGCISKRMPDEPPAEPVVLNEENSKVVTDPKNKFQLRLPHNTTLNPYREEAGARIFRVVEDGPRGDITRMFIEDNFISIDQAIQLLTSNEEVTQIAREKIKLGEHEGTKLTVRLDSRPGEDVPYYFIRPGGSTYVFSLNGGTPWEYFESVAQSFTVIE